jgi:hypothetical protein
MAAPAIPAAIIPVVVAVAVIAARIDNDDLVEFTLHIGPEGDLTNDTDLGFNIAINISLLEVELGYDIEIASDSTTLGPLVEFGETWPIGDIDLYDNTFALNFTTDNFVFAA